MKKMKSFKCPLCGCTLFTIDPTRFPMDPKTITLGEVQVRQCMGKKGVKVIDTHHLREHAQEYPELTKVLLDRMSKILISIVTNPPAGFTYRPEILEKLEEIMKELSRHEEPRKKLFMKTAVKPLKASSTMITKLEEKKKPDLFVNIEWDFVRGDT